MGRWIVAAIQIYAALIGISIVAGTIAGFMIRAGGNHHIAVRTATPDVDGHDAELAARFFALVGDLEDEEAT